jgi:hypothetical protein
MFLVVARRTLSAPAAGAALLLFAVLDGPIYYSAEAKQYELDVLGTLLVLAACLRVAQEPRPTRRTWVLLAAVGVVIPWFSHAATLVVVSSAGVLLLFAGLRRERRRLRALAAVAGLWALSAVAVYLVNIEELAGQGLGEEFIQLPPRSAADVRFLADSFAEIVRGVDALALSPAIGLLAIALVAAGAVSLLRRAPDLLALLVTPIALAAVVSSFERYPWGGRFTLFLLPLIVLLLVEGVVALARAPVPAAAAIAAAAFAAVAIPPAATAARHLAEPRKKEELRPLVRILGERYRAGDSVFVDDRGQIAFRYYARNRQVAGDPAPFRLPLGSVADRRTRQRALRSERPWFVIGSPRLRSSEVPRRARVWVLLSHDLGRNGRLLQALDDRGRRMFTATRTGVVLVLYDLEPATATGS